MTQNILKSYSELRFGGEDRGGLAHKVHRDRGDRIGSDRRSTELGLVNFDRVEDLSKFPFLIDRQDRRDRPFFFFFFVMAGGQSTGNDNV